MLLLVRLLLQGNSSGVVEVTCTRIIFCPAIDCFCFANGGNEHLASLFRYLALLCRKLLSPTICKSLGCALRRLGCSLSAVRHRVLVGADGTCNGRQILRRKSVKEVLRASCTCVCMERQALVTPCASSHVTILTITPDQAWFALTPAASCSSHLNEHSWLKQHVVRRRAMMSRVYSGQHSAQPAPARRSIESAGVAVCEVCNPERSPPPNST